MTTATQQAAALDAAALAVQIEDALRRRIGIRRLEDVEGPVALDEWSDSPFRGDEGLRFWVRTDSVTVYSSGPEGRAVHLKITAEQARELVLDHRAQDPEAAHARDLADGERVVASWRSSYDNDCRRLGDPSHPAYRDPTTVTHAERHSQFSTVGGAVHSRDLHSELIAKAGTALARLRAAGPHVPEQGRLF